MQERYLGDSHDFVKYALLRHIHRTCRWKLGVNWYLANPAEVDALDNSDGEKRHHLKGGKWKSLDGELLSQIAPFDNKTHRRLGNLECSGILPADTIYFSEVLTSQGRAAWNSRALSALSSADLIFMDPDNGLEVPSMTRRTAPKYALCSEVAEYYHAGKIVLLIQFARQCDPVQRAIHVRHGLCASLGDAAVLPVIRGRVAPNILFLSFAPLHCVTVMREAVSVFGAGSSLIETIE